MQPRLLSPGAEGVIQTLPETDGGARTLLGPSLGDGAVHAVRRIMALGAITGSLLAIGPFTAETASADSFAPVPAATLMAGPHQPVGEQQLSEEQATSTASSHTGPGNAHITMTARSARPHQATIKHSERKNSSHTGKADDECTDIVPFPGGYYYGQACANNSVLIVLGESTSDRFDYAMLIVNGAYKHGVFKGGTYKCGYVQKGIIPTDHSPHKSAGYCRQIARRILDPHDYIDDLSCDPGYCSGGTPTAPSPECRPAVTFYANFTSATRSPFNVYPDGQSGFVQPEGEQTDTLSYRATVKPSSQFGPAAIAYGQKVKWGLTLQECIPVQVLISSHGTNNSPPIKLRDALLPSEVAANSPLAATPTL